MRTAMLLASVGAVLIAAGVAFLSWPVGVICAGIEMVCAGYVAAYAQTRRKANA